MRFLERNGNKKRTNSVCFFFLHVFFPYLAIYVVKFGILGTDIETTMSDLNILFIFRQIVNSSFTIGRKINFINLRMVASKQTLHLYSFLWEKKKQQASILKCKLKCTRIQTIVGFQPLSLLAQLLNIFPSGRIKRDHHDSDSSR